MDKKIKILLVDDHDVMRKGIVSLLINHTQLEVAGEAANGKEALNFLKQHHADIVLLDIEMPVMDGKETLEKIVKRYRNTLVIMFSGHNDPVLISEFIKSGAMAFVSKSLDMKLLIDTIVEVHYTKKRVISREVSEVLLNDSLNKKELIRYTQSLSDIEKEILKALCNGKTNKEIAEKTRRSYHTIDSHRRTIYSKTNTTNIAELVRYAIKNGLL